MAKQIMIRRSFMTINVGHVIARGEYGGDEDIEDPQVFMRGYFSFLRSLNWEANGFTGVALALEVGDTGNWHIQGYAEHKQMRFTTLGKKLSCQPTAFRTVISSKDAYDYCTKKGVHANKPGVHGLFEWGEFKLHGDTIKADLKLLVGLALDGATPTQLFREYPYAWCVHRDRMIKFYDDIRIYARKSPREGPAIVGFSGNEEVEGGQ